MKLHSLLARNQSIAQPGPLLLARGHHGPVPGLVPGREVGVLARGHLQRRPGAGRLLVARDLRGLVILLLLGVEAVRHGLAHIVVVGKLALRKYGYGYHLHSSAFTNLYPRFSVLTLCPWRQRPLRNIIQTFFPLNMVPASGLTVTPTC